MINILADASLPDLSEFFQLPFHITLFNPNEDVYQQIQDHNVLLCRSTVKVDTAKLVKTPITCIATVSSGTDHITVSDLSQSIKIIDAKGANACAVADYVMACLAYCQQHHYVQGLTAGVIGVGAVGTLVSLRLQALGFHVLHYDPLRAAVDPQFSNCEFDALTTCDVLCVHANLHDQPPYASRHLLGASFLGQLKAGTVIINAARGDIVDERAVLMTPKKVYYCTDVYANEPCVNPALIEYATLCTPHIAGHSIEARRRSLQWVSQKLHRYFELSNGTSVADIEEHKQLLSQDFASWQEAILFLYNPEIDTGILKQAENKSKTFLVLRKGHHRHEFHCYEWTEKDSLLAIAVGERDTAP